MRFDKLNSSIYIYAQTTASYVCISNLHRALTSNIECNDAYLHASMHQLRFSLARCYCFNLRFYPDLIRAKAFIVHATIYIGNEYALVPMEKYMPNLMIFYLVIFLFRQIRYNG